MSFFRLVVLFRGLLCCDNRVSLFLLAFVLLLCGCTTTKYVPIETIRTEKVRAHDSIYIETVRHDSVMITSKGDTVDRWHTEYKDRWRDRWRDSVRVDSVAVPYPVEKELTWWERQKVAYGELVFGVMVLLLLLVIIRKRA